jgi:hypothetical protein
MKHPQYPNISVKEFKLLDKMQAHALHYVISAEQKHKINKLVARKFSTPEDWKGPAIIGYYGCYCHPFRSFKESDQYHKEKYQIGDRVQNRCNGSEGTVIKATGDLGFCSVKYGDLPRDEHQEHSASLQRII